MFPRSVNLGMCVMSVCVCVLVGSVRAGEGGGGSISNSVSKSQPPTVLLAIKCMEV